MSWKTKQMLKGASILVIVIAAIVSYQLYGISLGLDLAGGTHVVLEAQDSPDREVDAATMVSLHNIIERRINQLGLAEPRIQRSGDRRLIIELPAVDDPDRAVQIIGRTAQLTFRNMDDDILMTGEYLIDARADYDGMYRRPLIYFELDSTGARLFGQITQQYLGQRMQIYLDDEWLYSGTVESVITNRGQISGFSTLQEAQDVAMLLREGALPVRLQEEEIRTVGPTLGQIALEQSLRAGIAGLLIILTVMIIMYRTLGLAAGLALVVYGFVFVGLLTGFRAVLTLPGIAGLILSIGMAVDANIIIFERIKEETKFGKSARAAIDSGFKRAITAIIDANITTLITAMILAYFTSGTVRGFAITLILGILSSMFTSIFVTRTFIDYFYEFKLLKQIKTIELVRR